MSYETENLSAFEAGRVLERMTKDYQASQAAARRTAAVEAEQQGQATRERLNGMTSEQATAKIAALTADPEWRGRWLAGGSAEAREMADLVAAKTSTSLVDSILDGTALATAPNKGQSGPVPVRDVLAMVEEFRTAGLTDDAIRHTLENRPVSQAEHDETRRLRDRRLADPEWNKRMLAGHPDAVRELHLMSIVLASPIADAA